MKLDPIPSPIMIPGCKRVVALSDKEVLLVTIVIMSKLLERSSQNCGNLSSGAVLEYSQALDELIVAYYRL